MRKRWIAVLVVVVGALSIYGTRAWLLVERIPREYQMLMEAPRRDCPGHLPFTVHGPTGDSVTGVTELSLPGDITLVPEFHDCQRLLLHEAKYYGPLVGVFATNPTRRVQVTSALPHVVESLNAGLMPLPVTPAPGAAAAPTPNPIPVAEVVNFDPVPYAPLGIEPGFNCLYLYSDANAENGIAARMVPVGLDETKCLAPFDASMPGTDLYVLPRPPMGGLSWEDIPPVARWDWDPRGHTQYIGIRCGLHWCEVGPKEGLTSSPGHYPPLAKRKEKRTFWIKGWYDEQRLAAKVGNALRPLGTWGTIVPDSLLDEYDDATFPVERWVPAARIGVVPVAALYRQKFGFVNAVTPQRMDSLEICRATWAQCAAASGGTPAMPEKCDAAASPDWWARVKTARTGQVKYFCVTRTSHPGNFHMPGTARWRWRADDETMWVRCAQGCCEVNPPPDE